MGRQIVSAIVEEVKINLDKERGPGVKSAKPAEVDKYADRVIKYIPTEIVSLYLFVSHIIKAYSSADDPHFYVWFVVFAALLVSVPMHLWRTGVTSVAQFIISTIAFVVWVFVLPNPIDAVAPVHSDLSLYRAITLPLFTFAVGFFEPVGSGIRIANRRK
ncbi:hypothetical protein [Ensifer aridi]|uniref:hypothetical protein n=1 Tax=Ensifer aridi TaxID=1708715 RepID=UPI00111BF213|nr:hypothetical protein [Ensifer aridi]